MTDADAIGSDVTARWRLLREKSGCPTPFAHEDVVQGIARASDLRIESVFCEEAGHEAGCLLYVRRRGPLSQVVVPPFCFYSAVILPDDAPADIRDRLFSALLRGIRNVCPDANVVFPPGTQFPASARLPAPWSRSEFRTFRAEVVPVERAVDGWSAGSRARYRKHADEFTVESGPSLVPPILEHVSDAYDRHGRGLPIERSRLETLVRDLAENGHAGILGLRRPDSGELVAGIVLMMDATTAWDWIAGSVRGPGMTVCLGRAIEWLHRRGVKTLDFGGANIPAIATFKRQFGGDEVTYTSLETPTRPLVRWLSAVRSRIAVGG